MKIFKEILQYFKNDRQFDDREKRQLIDYSLHQALSYLRHYGENPRISLQPLNIPRTLVSALSDVKTSSNKESLRLAIVDTKFEQYGLSMTVVLATPQNTSRLLFTFGTGEFMAIHYYPDHKKHPHLYLLSAPGDVLELKGMRQPDKPKVIVESGGLVYTYRHFGTEESLTIKYGNIEAVMSHLAPLSREDGMEVDVWGTYVGTDRPPV